MTSGDNDANVISILEHLSKRSGSDKRRKELEDFYYSRPSGEFTRESILELIADTPSDEATRPSFRRLASEILDLDES